MAKKTVGKRKKSAKAAASFMVNLTNLKFIGAAFDEAINDLKAIKVNAKEGKSVQVMIDTLTDLKLKTARVCPQSWYAPFDLE